MVKSTYKPKDKILPLSRLPLFMRIKINQIVEERSKPQITRVMKLRNALAAVLGMRQHPQNYRKMSMRHK